MVNEQELSKLTPRWSPGTFRKMVIAAATKLADHGVRSPSMKFFENFGSECEDWANEKIDQAITAGSDEEAVSCIHDVRRCLRSVEHDVFLLVEEAIDPIISRLALNLFLYGNDGYNDLQHCHAWGASSDEPEWGTIWSMHQTIRDFTPAFLFKICMRGDSRFLAVECHAPTRILPEDERDRLRARTLMISGVPVIAFSPSEIEADACACTNEICDALAILATELIDLNNIDSVMRIDFRPRS
ncbi:hypothetical protein [Novacetimonas hansenii]|uniref:Uncharacterized protein n=1 Tax=Novacetimonas hansenii TaxID=436 RepID=A0AAW5EQ49_NOVHA|nr:hypothetical protein [Novacetimonas hansenii]MCJ8352943.1 hypothetical protein [Novacetimonas hansenii]